MREMSLILIFYMIPFCCVSCEWSLVQRSLIGCLGDKGVANFTLSPYPYSGDVSRSSNYTNFLRFSLQNLRFQSPNPEPAAIILPMTEGQLLGSFSCSKTHSFLIRIRSGGHSNEGLSTVIDNGRPYVIIDLINLNKIEVDVHSKTAWVEAGATLGELYYAIWDAKTGALSNDKIGNAKPGFCSAGGGESGGQSSCSDKGSHETRNESKSNNKTLAFPGGVCPTVGSGGHISGAGYGFLARSHGLAADHVVDFNLITSDAKILNKSTMDEDVFWAVRGGGGGSFGIVSKWKINLVEVPEKVTYFRISRSGDKLPLLIDKWQSVAPYLVKTFHLALEVKTDENKFGGSPYGVFQGLFQGPSSEASSILEERFPELNITKDELKDINWIDAITSLGNLRGAPDELMNRYDKGKKYYKAKTDYVKEKIQEDGVKGMIEKVAKERKGVVRLWPHGGMMDEIESDSIPFPHRRGTLYFIMYEVRWGEKDNGKSDDYLNWVREIYQYMTPFVSSNPRAAFVNYVDHELGQHWGEQYFGSSNCLRLVKAKKAIDPFNVFHHPHGIALDDAICNAATRLNLICQCEISINTKPFSLVST